MVPVRDFTALSVEFVKWNIDESVTDWIGVARSLSVVVETSEESEEVDEVRPLSDIDDLTGRVSELCVGKRR